MKPPIAPTEQAAFKALEAIQKDTTIPRARRRQWQKVFMDAAQIAMQPVRGRGRSATIDRKKILSLLGEGTHTYQHIADECGCSASYVAKVANGLR